ncbi:MAG TPA: hypothetical protein VFJ58_28315, partial [Armatimonadota bacterium]|nr:hypothetical protein [Armatimonadota bacterium]
WLEAGSVLLLLDGLDEVANVEFLANTVREALARYKKCPRVLSCREVSRDRLRSVGIDGRGSPVYTPAPLQMADREAYVTGYPFENRMDRSSLIEQLRVRSEFHTMAALPGLLANLCYAMDEDTNPALPRTRTALYDIVVTKMLGDTIARDDVAYPPGYYRPDAERRRTFLEQLALSLSDSPARPTEFSRAAVKKALEDIAARDSYPLPYVDSLMRDLTVNSRLLTGEADHGHPGTRAADYTFSHLTFQEFLVACALAARVQLAGWQTIRETIDRFCLMPEWQDIIIFLAGVLHLRAVGADSPEKQRLEDGLCDMLELLSDERKDDLFRHRLALAGLCLPEAQSLPSLQLRPSKLERISDRVNRALFDEWWAHREKGWNFPHLDRTLPSLAQINRNVGALPLMQLLLRRINSGNARQRELSFRALGQMGPATAEHREVVPSLLGIACDSPNNELRRSAINALRQMGPAAAVLQNVVPFLLEIAKDNAELRLSVVDAFGEMGPVTARDPAVIDMLRTSALTVSSLDLAWRARLALDRLPESLARHPKVGSDPLLNAADGLDDLEPMVTVRSGGAPAILVALRSDQDFTPSLAREALHQALGTTSFSRVVPSLLLPLLSNKSELDQRGESILNRMPRESRNLMENVRAVLTDHPTEVNNQPWIVRETLGVRAAAAAAEYPEGIPARLLALRSRDENTILRALQILGSITVPMHPMAVIPVLLITRDNDEPEQKWLGRAQITLDRILPTLGAHVEVIFANLQIQPDMESRSPRGTDLEELERTHPTSDHVNAIRSRLRRRRQSGSDSACKAVEALGRAGSAAALDPDVIPALLLALKSGDPHLVWRSAAALGRMGSAAAKHPGVLLAFLNIALSSSDRYLQGLAVDSLVREMAAGARIYRVRKKTWRVAYLGQLHL